MNFLNLKYFLVLAEELSYTQAAERLHISQQSLSAHIIRLEKQYGVQLFNREPPLRLTEAGEEFARGASRILQEKDNMERRLEEMLRFQHSSITIGVPTSRSAILLPEILAQFHKEYPEVTVHLIEGNSNDILKDLLRGTADLILGFQPEKSERLESHRIYLETTKIIVPNAILDRMPNREELLAGAGQPQLLRTFADCPFVALHESTLTGSVLHSIAQMEDFQPNVIMDTKNLLTMLSLCCAGIGVGICPNIFLVAMDSLISADLVKNITAFPLRSDYGSAWIALTWFKNKQQSVPEKRLIQMIRETYSRYHLS